MKITGFLHSGGLREQRSDALRRLTLVTDYRAERPCHGCQRTCACARRSASCACGCSPSCPHAAAALSQDPERYPIEPRILPLVFELNALRLVQPCWSCEGHADTSGRTIKAPRVWFYATAVVYAELLCQHVAKLKGSGKTQSPWLVSLCEFSEDENATAYALEPERGADQKLAVLQADVAAIAKDLAATLRTSAQIALTRLEG